MHSTFNSLTGLLSINQLQHTQNKVDIKIFKPLVLDTFLKSCLQNESCPFVKEKDKQQPSGTNQIFRYLLKITCPTNETHNFYVNWQQMQLSQLSIQ